MEVRSDYHNALSVPDFAKKLATGKKVIELNRQGPAYENSWAILSRSILKASAHEMDGKALSICASVVNRVYATEKQQNALLAISKKYAPNVYKNVRLDGERLTIKSQ